jgi:hypothetical protein
MEIGLPRCCNRYTRSRRAIAWPSAHMAGGTRALACKRGAPRLGQRSGMSPDARANRDQVEALPPLLFEGEPTRRANRALAHLPHPVRAPPTRLSSAAGLVRMSSVLQSCVADVHHMSAPRSDRTSFDVSRTPTKPRRRPVPNGSDINKGSSRPALQFARELICCSRNKLRGVVRRREKWQADDPSCLWRWQSVRSY